MTTYHWDHPTPGVRVQARIDYWLDRLEEGDGPTTGDWCYEWLNRSARTDIELWGSMLGEGRRLLRQLKIDAPEAWRLIEHVEERLEIYVQHVAWAASRAQGWGFGEPVATGLDHVATYGPAGRDVGWGLTPIPRW